MSLSLKPACLPFSIFPCYAWPQGSPGCSLFRRRRFFIPYAPFIPGPGGGDETGTSLYSSLSCIRKYSLLLFDMGPIPNQPISMYVFFIWIIGVLLLFFLHSFPSCNWLRAPNQPAFSPEHLRAWAARRNQSDQT